MNVNHSKYICNWSFLIIFLSILFTGCKKEEAVSDHPVYKYIGRYQTHLKVNSYGSVSGNPGYSYEKDTVISVKPGNTQHSLWVLGREIVLDTAGYFYDYHYSIHLWNDSIISTFMNGGLGGGVYEVYTGYRISLVP